MAAAPPVAVAAYPAAAAAPAGGQGIQGTAKPAAKLRTKPPMAPVAEGGRYHYAASNGKWTIGGLSKSNVYSMIVHNGIE